MKPEIRATYRYALVFNEPLMDRAQYIKDWEPHTGMTGSERAYLKLIAKYGTRE